MVAFRAAAWDLDALRGAHGGGRSVRPGRLSAARPRAPPAPRLRVALGTWHSQPPEPGRTARREMVSGQPGRCDAADSAPFRKPAGTVREREAGRGRRGPRGRNYGSERDAWLRGPGVDKTHLGAGSTVPEEKVLGCSASSWPESEKEESKCRARWALGLF